MSEMEPHCPGFDFVEQNDGDSTLTDRRFNPHFLAINDGQFFRVPGVQFDRECMLFDEGRVK